MKRILGISLLSVCTALSTFAFTLDTANKIATTDGSQSDVSAAIASSSVTDGWIVQLPSGTFNWSSSVSIGGKGIHLRGAGSGRIVGRSTSSLSVGTGSKTLTTQSGLSLVSGQVVKIINTANYAYFMDGTVVSYSGTTLQVNVTASGGSGSRAFWVICTDPATTINLNSGFNITEDATHSVELSGFKMVVNNNDLIIANGVSNGRPILWHDCWISVPGTLRAIRWQVNRGVIWECSFDAGFDSGNGTGFGREGKLIVFKNEGNTSSWATPSTMGMADTTGLNNFYMEDCDYHGMSIAAMDMDDNSRTVVRRCLFNNTSFGTHGADTSNYGVRHYEIYENEFVWTDATDPETFNIPNGWFFNRGGTGLIANNIVPNITSQEWGNKPELIFTVMNLRRNGGPNPCWKGGYPAPRQVGMGYVSGSGGFDNYTYRGDSEPLYMWGNTGGYANPSITDYASTECSTTESSSAYIVSGRDYFPNTPKPGWTPYTYPHPMRTDGAATQEPARIVTQPQNLSVTQGQTSLFSVVAAGSSPFSYQWQKNGINLSGAVGASYSIASTQSNDMGGYRCVVANTYGSVTSAVATLTVTVPQLVAPSITSQPQSLTRAAGQGAMFSVTASGTSPLSYQWQKNAVNISGATTASFSILSVASSDAGSYRCTVTNHTGSVTSAVATLTVEAAAPSSLRYVDFTAGNDGNPGTMSSPWRRCPGMVGWAGSATLQPGDTVYFDRADQWDISANSFGPGLDLKAGVKYVGDQWDPQGVGARRATLRAIGRHEAGNVRFWEDHASLPTQFEGFDVDGNGYRANGIDINHAFWTTGLTDAVKRIKNCIVHGQTGNGSEGDYKYGIIVSDNSPDASGRVANVEILDTVVYDVPRVGISIYPSDTGMLSNIVVRGCEVYRPNTDPSYTRTHGIGFKGDIRNSVVENCYVHDVGGAAVFISGPENSGNGAPTGFTVRYNILQCGAEEGVIRFYSWGNKSADIYGNIVLANEVGGGFSMSGNSGTHAVKVYNNTFYNSFVTIGGPSSTGTLEFKNNLVYELDDVPLTDSNSKITAHSNNAFYRVNGGTLVSLGGTSYTASTLGSFEATASAINPGFKNTANLPSGWTGSYGVNLAPNNDGLSLSASSPVLGLGAVLSSPYSGSINTAARPATGAWNPGAYQISLVEDSLTPPTGLKAILGP